MRKSHPWRDRSREFIAHLDTLSPAERQQIQAAERQFLAKRDAPFSLEHRTARDFSISMIGVREDDLTTY